MLVNKTKKKHRALKSNTAVQSGFFRALVFGFVTCLGFWIALALVFSLVMSGMEDSGSAGKIMSPVIVVLRLLAGGFAAGKADKSCAALSSFVLGTACLGICYVLSSVLELSRNLDAVMKTVMIAVMLVCPLFGARLATREKGRNTRHRKRM